MSRADALAAIESGLLAMRGKNNGVITAAVALSASETGFLLADASASAFEITLPSATQIMDVRVQRVDNSGNRLLIRAFATEKVLFHTHLRAEGYPFFILMGAGDFWHLRSDGAGNWRVLHRLDTTPIGRPVLETTTAFQPGGWAGHNGIFYNRHDWPWAWDHAQASGMLTTEALRAGNEGMWTTGDGVTTFRCPEVRGEFLRVLDEGRDIDTGRVSGTWQDGTWLRTVAQEWSGSDAPTGVSIFGNAFAGADGRIATGGVGGKFPPGANPPSGVGEYSAFTTDNAVSAAHMVNNEPFNNWIRFKSRNIAYPGRIKII